MNHLRLVYSRPTVTPYLVTAAEIGLGMVIWCVLIVGICALSLRNALPRQE